MRLMSNDLPSRSWCIGLCEGTGKGLTQGQVKGTNNFKDQDKAILVQNTKAYGKVELWIRSFFNLGWRRAVIFTP